MPSKGKRERAAAKAAPKETQGSERNPLVTRISMSLSEQLLSDLDAMVDARGFASRSHAVSTILHRSLADYSNEIGDRVMVGTITMFYGNKVKGLQAELAALQQAHIAEIISSLHVHLDKDRTLEVVLVQGPAKKVREIADLMLTKRGVITGKLELVAALIPQIHPFR